MRLRHHGRHHSPPSTCPLQLAATPHAAQIDTFRHQVKLVDHAGVTDIATLTAAVAELAGRAPSPPENGRAVSEAASARRKDDGAREDFVVIRPGGKRRPLTYDPAGFFVITVDWSSGEIVCRHYRADHTPAHEMRGRSAEAMLLGLLNAGVVSQLSHAGYLGSELTKAETALRLGLAYEQDRPLRTGRT